MKVTKGMLMILGGKMSQEARQRLSVVWLQSIVAARPAIRQPPPHLRPPHTHHQHLHPPHPHYPHIHRLLSPHHTLHHLDVRPHEDVSLGLGVVSGVADVVPVVEFMTLVDGENFDPEPLVFDNSEAGVQAEFPCTATSSVLQFFTAFFDLAVMQYLVWEINCFREISVRWLAPLKVPKESKMKAWTDVSVEELYVWFALTMLMPHVKKHVLQDYWIVGDLISTPSFGKWMPRDRYLLILRYLHFTNNYGPKPIDRLWKVDRLKAWEWMSRHKLALLPHLPSGRKGSRRCHVCANTTRKAPARKET
ncbi:hypothetical protein O3P69_002651 [Scylla paramamosain]|uniref:PiggyBac transposable element-derived protein domain-containing protein n=1 Tax=Scylla paramamosain TaxID=85552 RepID=A0AAW0UMY3_SCYPA